MDKAKLESLRARYANGDVFDATDPALRRAAAAVETPGGQRRAPYTGIPTFLDLLDIVGADVVEVAPQYDPTTNTTLLAAQLLFEEFALMTTRDLAPARDI